MLFNIFERHLHFRNNQSLFKRMASVLSDPEFENLCGIRQTWRQMQPVAAAPFEARLIAFSDVS
jgi:hypothetical protein